MNSIFPDIKDGMNIEWVVSNVCNYSCSYCVEDLYGGSSGQPDYKKALKFFDYLHNNISSGNKLLNLTGGEPTVWADLIPFLQGLDKSYLTQLTTNGSRTVRWWNKLLDNYDNLARVAISTHLEFANIEHILNVSKLLHDKTDLTILMLADRKNFGLVKKYAPMFEELDCTVFIKPIRNRDGLSQDYTEEEQNYIKNFKKAKKDGKHIGVPTHLVVDNQPKPYSYGLELISKNQHSFKGWKCALGKTRLVIWHDGSISLAQCSTAKNMKIGNMFDEKIDIPTEPVVCMTNYCTCLPDIRIPKWRENVQV
jgi:organic radical activating enzyme